MFDALKKRLASFIGQTEEKALKKASDSESAAEEIQEVAPISEAAPEARKSQPATKLSVKTKVKTLISKNVKLTEDDLEDTLSELQLSLMQADVAVETSEYLIECIRDKLVGEEMNVNEIHSRVVKALRETLLETLTQGGEINVLENIRKSGKPYKILFLGVNGTGKTTTIAKFAHLLKENGYTTVLAAADTFRAGAIEQLDRHAGSLDVRVIKHAKGADAAAVIYDAVEHARARKIDVVLADSAGRMQTNINLMDELKKIVRVNKPDLKVFVGDALTGNDVVEQAKRFHEIAGVDAVILSKMDADAKGGAALSIAHAIGKPIIFVGVGQSYADLKKFDPIWFVEQII